MESFENILEICRLLILADDAATVATWRDAAKARITAGGGAVTVLTGASLAGKSSTASLVADPVVLLRATLTALQEAADGRGEETRIFYPSLQ